LDELASIGMENKLQKYHLTYNQASKKQKKKKGSKYDSPARKYHDPEHTARAWRNEQ
jgi:hypothetical protein